MDRRDLLSLLGAGTTGLIGIGTARAFSESLTAGTLDKSHQECLNACVECARSCEMMFHHCFKLTAQGHQEHAKAAQIALDCAEFCGLSAKLIARMSPLMAISCSACAEACKKCGDECARSEMAEMKACAEICRKCEQSCREMAKAMHT